MFPGFKDMFIDDGPSDEEGFTDEDLNHGMEQGAFDDGEAMILHEAGGCESDWLVDQGWQLPGLMHVLHNSVNDVLHCMHNFPHWLKAFKTFATYMKRTHTQPRDQTLFQSPS